MVHARTSMREALIVLAGRAYSRRRHRAHGGIVFAPAQRRVRTTRMWWRDRARCRRRRPLSVVSHGDLGAGEAAACDLVGEYDRERLVLVEPPSPSPGAPQRNHLESAISALGSPAWRASSTARA